MKVKLTLKRNLANAIVREYEVDASNKTEAKSMWCAEYSRRPIDSIDNPTKLLKDWGISCKSEIIE